MEKEVLHKLLDNKKIAVLYLLYTTKEEMYLREIAKKSGISLSSVFRLLKELSGINLVKTRTIKTLKLYSLVRDERTSFLQDWFGEEDKLKRFVAELKEVEGVQKILLTGKLEKNQGNIIVIGVNIDSVKVDDLCAKTKEQGLDLSNVVLTGAQFLKLDKMGIYGGEKKVLYPG